MTVAVRVPVNRVNFRLAWTENTPPLPVTLPTVVVPSAVRDALGGEQGFRLRPLGVRRVKDIGSTWLWAVTRGEVG